MAQKKYPDFAGKKKPAKVSRPRKKKKPALSEEKTGDPQATAVQWFPGHMAKTRRLIQENLKLVDLVLELADARIPSASRNPELSRWLGEKPRILLLNKSDQADPEATRRWLEYYRQTGLPAMACDCKSGAGVSQFLPLLKKTIAPLLEKRANKGMAGRLSRVMVVGVPNVGKSSFINRMSGQKRAKVEDRPGVTRSKQWVSLEQDIELLDMPGVLWPKFDDPVVGEKLAFTGAVKDNILDAERLAARLLERLAKDYPERLTQRYKLEELSSQPGYALLEQVARKRGMLISGGEADTERAAAAVLDEYRAGKIGRITLEFPEDTDKKTDDE